MEITYRPYSFSDKEACLALFDMNCPEYFAPNEREDYDNFLVSNPTGYELCVGSAGIAGAFGLIEESANQG